MGGLKILESDSVVMIVRGQVKVILGNIGVLFRAGFATGWTSIRGKLARDVI